MIVDVSHHHPVTNWTLAKSSATLLISKATEGTTYVDPTWKTFAQGCEKNGIPFWLFFFIRKGKEVDSVKFGIKTCDEYVRNCKCFVGYAIDCETDLNKVDPNPSGAKASMDYLEKYCLENGYKSMFYSGYKDYDRYSATIKNIGSNSAFWEARYNGKLNSCHKDVDIHQYSSSGKCAFIGGGAGDVNTITGFGKPLEWFVSKDKTVEKPIVNPTEEYNMKVIKKGSRGNAVKVWQIIVGADPDGVFGSTTQRKTEEFQKAHKIGVDGIVGKESWKVGIESLWGTL